MAKLKISLSITSDNVVRGNVTYMDESLRNTGSLVKIEGFEIRSISSPQLTRDTLLYVWGDMKHKDNEEFAYRCSSYSQASELVDRIKACLVKLNGAEEKDKLTLELFLSGITIKGSVVHMDESLRGAYSIVELDGFTLCSSGRPELRRNELYLGGFAKSAARERDDDEFQYCYDSKDEAERTLLKIKACVAAVNSSVENYSGNTTILPEVKRKEEKIKVMDKLQIKLFRYGCLVFGKVILQSKELETKETLATVEGFEIARAGHPELKSGRLYVMGSDCIRNADEFHYRYDSAEDAASACKKIKRGVELINNPEAATEAAVGIPGIVEIM